jgi:hypothetical protein
VDWVQLAEDRVKSQAIVNTIMKLLVPQKARDLFSS